MEFYCESCETAMCHECTEGEHREHVTVPLRDVVEQHKAALQQQLDAIKSRYRRRGAVLQAQLDALCQGQENILSSCAFTEQALHHGTETEVLLVKKQMSERLSELASQEFPEHPHENDQLDYVVETDGVRKSILNLGVLITTSATAHKTVATGEGLRHAVVGQPSSLSVTTKDKDGELVRSGSASLRFQVTAPDGSAAESEVLDNKNGTYELLYTPRAEGDFLLSILLYGQPIRGSPFRVRAIKASDVPPSPDDVKRRVNLTPVSRPQTKIGAGRLMGPKGVAVDRNGHIIVVDNKACCVFIFQSNGKLVTKFGSRGTAERQFAGPHFVAVNNKNEIVVTDFHNHSVKVYNADGEFLFKFGSHGEGNGQFNAPTGVAVDANGNIIVADWGNSRIQVRARALALPPPRPAGLHRPSQRGHGTARHGTYRHAMGKSPPPAQAVGDLLALRQAEVFARATVSAKPRPAGGTWGRPTEAGAEARRRGPKRRRADTSW
nr:PREDICTED: tripartite motif-containing protein 3 [Apteryx mantelli mantelli]